MSGPRVLVVDDQFVFAQAIAAAVGELGRFELIGIAVTGPQALAMAREHRPDLVLLDFHLPGYAADSLIPRIRAVSPSARIVVLTADASERAMAAAMDAGADVFITKDKAIEDVLDALARFAPGEAAPVTAAPAGPLAPLPPVALEPSRDAAPPPPPVSPVTQEATEPVETAQLDGRESLLMRIAGAGTFARAARLEGFLADLPQVHEVHIRDIDGELATLRVVLARGLSVDDLVGALAAAPFALEPGPRAPGALDIVAPRAGRG